MIAHIFPDGSVGEEHEVGDKVETCRVIHTGNATEKQHSIPVGTKGIVKWLKPYNANSTYHTIFAAVYLESYGIESELNSTFKSLEAARKIIVEGINSNSLSISMR